MNQPDHPSNTHRSLTMTLLGIGGAFDADLGVANTNALLELRQGQDVIHRTLLDCGHTCGRQLQRLGLGYNDIDTVLITHTHGDHIDGLEVAGYKNLFLYQHRCQVIATDPILKDIWQSLSPKMSALQVAPGEVQQATLATYLEPVSAGGAEGGLVTFADGALTVRFVPVEHVAGMLAYALLISFGTDTKAPTLRWSGDCTFDADSVLFKDLSAERGDLVFHDCSFYPAYPATVHTHYDELQTLPLKARQHTILVHHGKDDPNACADDAMRLGLAMERFVWQWDAD